MAGSLQKISHRYPLSSCGWCVTTCYRDSEDTCVVWELTWSCWRTLMITELRLRLVLRVFPEDTCRASRLVGQTPIFEVSVSLRFLLSSSCYYANGIEEYFLLFTVLKFSPVQILNISTNQSRPVAAPARASAIPQVTVLQHLQKPHYHIKA